MHEEIILTWGNLLPAVQQNHSLRFVIRGLL